MVDILDVSKIQQTNSSETYGKGPLRVEELDVKLKIIRKRDMDVSFKIKQFGIKFIFVSSSAFNKRKPDKFKFTVHSGVINEWQRMGYRDVKDIREERYRSKRDTRR